MHLMWRKFKTKLRFHDILSHNFIIIWTGITLTLSLHCLYKIIILSKYAHCLDANVVFRLLTEVFYSVHFCYLAAFFICAWLCDFVRSIWIDLFSLVVDIYFVCFYVDVGPRAIQKISSALCNKNESIPYRTLVWFNAFIAAYINWFGTHICRTLFKSTFEMQIHIFCLYVRYQRARARNE